MNAERIADLEVLLGHVFRDKDLLLNALSHSSVKTEDRPSNERLEFLGDSVLGLIVSDALYRRFPEDDEGSLTRIKSHAVSRATLQRIAAAMGLDRFILVGKGVMKREIPASLLGNLFEAMIGAIYLDSGLAAARKFTLRHLDVIVEEIVQDRAERNYKSILQHYCQREHGGVPTYRLIRESGPAHHRVFEVVVLLHGREYGRARAPSKKEAEQGAARAALLYWRAIPENARDPVRGAGQLVSMGNAHHDRSPQEGGRGRDERRFERGPEGGGRGFHEPRGRHEPARAENHEPPPSDLEPQESVAESAAGEQAGAEAPVAGEFAPPSPGGAASGPPAPGEGGGRRRRRRRGRGRGGERAAEAGAAAAGGERSSAGAVGEEAGEAYAAEGGFAGERAPSQAREREAQAQGGGEPAAGPESAGAPEEERGAEAGGEEGGGDAAPEGGPEGAPAAGAPARRRRGRRGGRGRGRRGSGGAAGGGPAGG